MISEIDFEDEFLRRMPISNKGGQGKELIKGYFRKNPEEDPKSTSVEDIATVIYSRK